MICFLKFLHFPKLLTFGGEKRFLVRNKTQNSSEAKFLNILKEMFSLVWRGSMGGAGAVGASYSWPPAQYSAASLRTAAAAIPPFPPSDPWTVVQLSYPPALQQAGWRSSDPSNWNTPMQKSMTKRQKQNSWTRKSSKRRRWWRHLSTSWTRTSEPVTSAASALRTSSQPAQSSTAAGSPLHLQPSTCQHPLGPPALLSLQLQCLHVSPHSRTSPCLKHMSSPLHQIPSSTLTADPSQDR